MKRFLTLESSSTKFIARETLRRYSLADEVFQHQVLYGCGSSRRFSQLASSRQLLWKQFVHGRGVLNDANQIKIKKEFDALQKISDYTMLPGDRAHFHATSYLSSRHPKISSNLKCADNMKLELRLINTPAGFLIHYISPVEIKGNKVARLRNGDDDFVRKLIPYYEGYLKTLPANLRTMMDKYWLSLNEGVSHDEHRAARMLRHGVQNNVFLFDNYWDEAVKIAKPFLEEGGEYFLGKMLEDFPRGRVYNCKAFIEGMSERLGKKVSIRYKKDSDDQIVPAEFLFLIEEQRILMDHLEPFRGPFQHVKEGEEQFFFKGTSS